MGKVIDMHSFKQCWTYKSFVAEKSKATSLDETLKSDISQLPELEKVVALNPGEYLASCDSRGNILFWAKGEVVYQTAYQAQSLTKKMENFPVSAFAYNGAKKLLILGDLFGNISIWNMTKFLDKLNSLFNQKEKWNNWIEKKKANFSMKKPDEGSSSKV